MTVSCSGADSVWLFASILTVSVNAAEAIPLGLNACRCPALLLQTANPFSWKSTVQSDLAELNMTNNWSTLLCDKLAQKQLLERVRPSWDLIQSGKCCTM